MKKIFTIMLGMLLSLATFAQSGGVKWEEGTLQQALDKAKSNKKGPKMVFLDCYTTWCGPCKHMANVVFPTKEAGDYFNKNFVNIKIDMEKGEGIDIKNKYGVTAFPTFLVLDENGKEVGRVLGSDKLENFIVSVEKAKDPANSLTGMLEKYKQNRDIKDAYAYLNKLDRFYMSDKIGAFFTAYYKEMSPKDKYSKETWSYLKKGLTVKDYTIIEDLLSNKSIFEQIAGEGAVDAALYQTLMKDLKAYLMGKLDVSKEELEKICILAWVLSDGSKTDNVFIKAARAYGNKDMQGVANAFNDQSLLYSCTPMDIAQLQRIFLSMKEVPEGEKARFVKNQKDFLENQTKKNSQIWEQYKEVEIPEKKSEGVRAAIMM